MKSERYSLIKVLVLIASKTGISGEAMKISVLQPIVSSKTRSTFEPCISIITKWFNIVIFEGMSTNRKNTRSGMQVKVSYRMTQNYFLVAVENRVVS